MFCVLVRSTHIYHSCAQLLEALRRVVKPVSGFIGALKHSLEFLTFQPELSCYIHLWCHAASCNWVTKQYVTVQYNDSAFPHGHKVWKATRIHTQQGRASIISEQSQFNVQSLLTCNRFNLLVLSKDVSAFAIWIFGMNHISAEM